MATPGRSLRSAAWVAAGLAAVAVAAQLALVAQTSVAAPFLDDWDALVGFLVYWQDAPSSAGRLRQLFDPHNEHLLAVPRLAALGIHGLAGHLDFTALNEPAVHGVHAALDFTALNLPEPQSMQVVVPFVCISWSP